MRFASASIAARIDFRRNTPTSSQCQMFVQCRRVAAPAEAWSKFRTPNRSLFAGVGALSNNTESDDNRAIGADALFFNISGDNNAALGRSGGVSTQFAVAASPSGDRIEMGKSAHKRP